MQTQIRIYSNELSRICSGVDSAGGSLNVNSSGVPYWNHYVGIRQWDKKGENIVLELQLKSRDFQGNSIDRHGMPACEESLWALLAELNQIGCDVVMDSLKEHLIKEKKQ